jgi:anti-sigma factor RsiW
MNCAGAAERITALVDGELPPAEREELEAHLTSCAACREARAAEEAVAARLRSAPRPALPAGFSADVMAKVAGGAASPAGRVLPLWPLLAAASAVAAAVVAMVIVGPGVDRAAGPLPPAGLPVASGVPAREAVEDAVSMKSRDAADEEAPPAAPATPAPAPTPVQAPAADVGLVVAGEVEKKEAERKEPGEKADKAKQVPAEETRAAAKPLVLRYKVRSLPEAQQSVESVLLAQAALATREGAWKTEPLAKSMEMNVVAGENRTLLLRVRPENLERFRGFLEQRFLAGVYGKDAGASAGPAAAGGKAPAPAPTGGGGQEAGPPPKPSQEQLKRLAEAPPPAREGPTVVDGEVLVEIRLEQEEKR